MHLTTTAADNAPLWASSGTDVNVANSGVADQLLFGLKDADTPLMPGEAGAQFFGIMNPVGLGTRFWADGSNTLISTRGPGVDGGSFGVSSGTTRTVVNSTGNNALRMAHTGNNVAPGATLYAGFNCLEIELLDRGLATQRVIFRSSQTPNLTDTSKSALRTLINAFASPQTHAGSVAANNGTTAFPVPTKFVIRLPFFNHRAKVYSWMAVQVA